MILIFFLCLHRKFFTFIVMTGNSLNSRVTIGNSTTYEEQSLVCKYRQLRARWALTLFKAVPFRTTRALLLYEVYGDRILLVLNRTFLNSINALLALNRYIKFLSNLTLSRVTDLTVFFTQTLRRHNEP